jgi:hypothetical protein
MNQQLPSKHIGGLVVPLIGGLFFVGGVRDIIEYVRWLETAPGTSSVFGQPTAQFHLNPFPGRLLWNAVAVSVAGAVGFACIYQAIVRDKERQGNLATALVAGIIIPLLLIIGISSHDLLLDRLRVVRSISRAAWPRTAETVERVARPG